VVRVTAVRSQQLQIGEFAISIRHTCVTDQGHRLDWWAQRNMCTNKTEEILNDGEVHHYSWSCDGKEGLLQHYKVNGLGKYDVIHAVAVADTWRRPLLG
jgi:hypothetical protein